MVPQVQRLRQPANSYQIGLMNCVPKDHFELWQIQVLHFAAHVGPPGPFWAPPQAVVGMRPPSWGWGCEEVGVRGGMAADKGPTAPRGWVSRPAVIGGAAGHQGTANGIRPWHMSMERGGHQCPRPGLLRPRWGHREPVLVRVVGFVRRIHLPPCSTCTTCTRRVRLASFRSRVPSRGEVPCAPTHCAGFAVRCLGSPPPYGRVCCPAYSAGTGTAAADPTLFAPRVLPFVHGV